MTAEAEEAKAAAAQAIDEATKSKQDLEQAKSHMATIESRLHAAQLEVEAVKASEERALSQVAHITHFLQFLIGYTFCLVFSLYAAIWMWFLAAENFQNFIFVLSYGLNVYGLEVLQSRLR